MSLCLWQYCTEEVGCKSDKQKSRLCNLRKVSFRLILSGCELHTSQCQAASLTTTVTSTRRGSFTSLQGSNSSFECTETKRKVNEKYIIVGVVSPVRIGLKICVVETLVHLASRAQYDGERFVRSTSNHAFNAIQRNYQMTKARELVPRPGTNESALHDHTLSERESARDKREIVETLLRRQTYSALLEAKS